jgi:DNA-binding NtrC family response regulator
LVDGAAQPMLQAASPLGRGERILIVERERTAGELAAAMLTGLGYAPLRAHDARSALQALTEHGDISLLLTSLALTGGMSGPELAQAARQQRPDLKVLYTVGRIEHARFHDGRGETAAELLEKPFRVETLARKVRAALDGSAAQPAESDRPHVSG